MTLDNKLILLIPARSGSKRLKNKNLRKVNNKPLLYYKIKACLNTGLGKVIVSTNSKKISKYSARIGASVPFLRPKKYSTSHASTISVVLNYLRYLKKKKIKYPNYIGIFPPTNPFLKSKTIINAYNILLKNKKFESIVSYTNSYDHLFNFINIKKKKILFNRYKINNKNYSSFERTQDRPVSHVVSPALRITKTKYYLSYIKNIKSSFKKKPFNIKNCTGIYIDNLESFDINNKGDLELAKIYIKNNKKIIK